MGYYTRFDMNYKVDKGESVSEKEIVETLRSLSDYFQYDRISETFEDLFQDEEKWYDYENDMINLSLHFPNVKFILSGTGEEPMDIWRHYFYDDESQHAKAEIIFEESKIF